ncbi:hypothetical protein [Actinomadura sp. NTSP31]|uniref:hypothetical protein n=1 Tax=Actinomadura sp. NTSP31 TaxID=1735447 RepID=UPI0035C0A2EA
MNHSTEPNEPDGVPETALDARPDLETIPLTDTPAEVTPPLGTEQVPWGGRELVESVYGPLTDQYEALQARLTEDGPGWSAQIAALRALRAGHVAGDWETLARLLVAPGSLEVTGTVGLVQTADEPETVHALLRGLKTAGERTLLLTSTPEQAAALLETLQEDPDLLPLLAETRPLAPPAEPEGTLKLPAVPEAAPAVQPVVRDQPPAEPEPEDDRPAVQFREDFGSHGTIEFKPVTGLPEPGAGAAPDATRAEPLPDLPGDQPDAPAVAETRPEPPAGAGPTDTTLAQPLPVLPDDQPDVTPPVPPSDMAETPSAAGASDTTLAQPLPGSAGDRPDAPGDADAPLSAPVGLEEGQAGSAVDVTRPEGLSGRPGSEAGPGGSTAPLPDDDEHGTGGRAGLDVEQPETWVRGAVLRPVGEAWPQSWRAEAGVLRRGLMWLEQWPRDAETLAAVQAEGVARKEALDAELDGLARAIEAARDAARSAEQGAVEAEAEAERLVAVQQEAEAELAGPRAEADRLQAVADAAGAEASELTRVADEAYARCAQLDERARNAQHELQGAQQVEASLKDELARAQEALPAAAEEADRLAAVDADASAEGHAAYYRLVSAESALAAVRRKMSLAQRLHVAAPPSDFKSVRAEVRARTRDADEAAKRAQEAKDAAERAEAHRQGLAGFVSEGGARLAMAREAQERLTTELAWLATERETAGAEHQEQARRAAESVDRATQAGLEARAAQQAARGIEERVEAAAAARREALAAAERARADAEAATAREAEARAALERRTADGEREIAAHAAELESAAEAEARSRGNVREICGADPADDPDAIARHQRLAMARIEELGGLLEGGEADGAALLPAADLVVGTPLGVGAALGDERFDALVAVGGLADAEFLVGAVRTARWFLVGPPPAEAPEDEGRGTYGRSAVAAPHLLSDAP